MKNGKLIDEFLEKMKNEELSETLINSYRNDLETLNEFLRDFSILNFEKFLLIDYIEFLRNNFTNNTVIKKLNSFKRFFSYLSENKLVSKTLLDELKNFKNKFSIPEIISEEELEKLFRVCEPSLKGIRDRLVIELMLKTGMQLNKVLDLDTEGVNETSISFDKNNKKYMIKVDENLSKLIVSYKKNSICGEKKLFIGLTRQNFFARIKKYQKDAQLDREINPVMLKNTAIYGFIEEGIPMSELKDRLDYANIGMSGIYKIRNKSDIKRVYEKISIGDWDVSEFN